MQSLNNFDLSLVELGEIARPGGTDIFRRSGISLIWTPLPDFGAYVLNVFAPNAHVFWNFYLYERLVESERRFLSQFLSNERIKQTHSILTRLIRQAGHKKKSDFAHLAFGAWTRTPEFNPNESPTPLSYLTFRHWSILVPEEDREAVHGHLEQQANCFDDDVLLRYPETDREWHFDELNKETPHWKLLNCPIIKTTSDDRAWLYEEARRYESFEVMSKLATALDVRFALKGMFNLTPVPTQFVSFVDMEQYAEVLRFRARLALLVCPLPQIEKLVSQIMFDMRSGINVGEYPEGLREECLSLLFGRLKPYKAVIEFEFPSLSRQ